MKLRYLSIIVVLATIILSLSHQEYAHSNAAQPDPGHTGAPNETTCNVSGCHTGGTNVTSSSIIIFDAGNALTNGYTPGTTYNISLNFNASTAKKGFELTALTSANQAAGTLALGNGSNANITSLQTSNGRQYIGHKNASSTAAWVFKWTAPSTNVGDVTFYVAANAANGDGSNQGDVIHTNNFVIHAAGGGGCALTAQITGNPTLCSGITTLTAASTGGTGTDAYLWSDNSTGRTLSTTTAGTYSVTITNATCTATSSINITSPTPASSSFSVSTDSSGAHFINSSATGTGISYLWNFDDGTTSTTGDAQFVHAYSTAGTYNVVLTVTDGCGTSVTHTQSVTITIPVHTGIANVDQRNVSVFPNPITDNFNITVDGNTENFQLTIYSLTGKVVRSEQGVTGSAMNLNRNGLSKGIYIYHIILRNTTLSGKLIVE